MKRLSILLILLIAITTGNTFAQSKKEIRAQQVVKKQEQVEQLLKNKTYKIDVDRATTTLKSKPTINITGEYGLTVTPDKLISQLPYYGRAYSAPYSSSSSPLDFESTNFKYEQMVKKNKNNIIKISATPSNSNSSVNITIEITPTGNVSMTILSNNLSTITFSGNLEPIEE